MRRVTRFCRTHPTYALRRHPRSSCQACWRAWRLKCAGMKALGKAADAFKQLYQTRACTAEVRWPRGTGIGSVAAVRLVVYDVPPTSEG